jgi:hypothetical protein
MLARDDLRCSGNATDHPRQRRCSPWGRQPGLEQEAPPRHASRSMFHGIGLYAYLTKCLPTATSFFC